MRKYRRTSQPDENDYRLPRNPVPWTTKFLIGILICLAAVFILLLVFREDRSPILTSLIEKFGSRELVEETNQPDAVAPMPIPTPTFPPGSAWLAAIKFITIFSGPGEENTKLGMLEGGEKARIVGKNPDSDWWAIRVPYVEGEIGWVNDAQVQAYDTGGVTVFDETDVVSASETEVVPADELPRLQAIAPTNVRSGPGMEFERIGLLSEGQEAEILGKDPNEFWWLIKIASVEGERGWVSRDFVVAQKAEEVPVVGTSSIQFGAVPTPAEGEPALSSAVVINIRAGPGTNFAIIGKLAPDQKAVIVGVSPDGTWWAVRIPAAQNQRGWISSQYAAVENAEGVPVIR